MRAVIISGGAISDYACIKAQIRDTDTIICADSGFDHAVKMGLHPTAVVGDFDSVRTEISPEIEQIKFPTQKNFTDTEIAIAYARERGFDDFLLLGATGSRLDHTLTNILNLKNFAERGETAQIFDEHNKITLVHSSTLQMDAPPGTIVSIVAITDCKGVTEEGFKYPLQNADVYVGSGLGVSNVVRKNASVRVAEGLLLVIVARD
ncbi:MAG: thiamine diphosphokinase [Defluviitaleaceae bacterium]|nr:thiamine diphosphokinase [Defluviitaleaceae bacterium]